MENKKIKSSMGFYDINLKVANMRNVQSFTLYPKVTEAGEVWLQSDKRFIAVNVFDGKAVINKSNKNYASRHDLILGGITFDFDKDVIAELKDHYENHKVGTNQVKSGDTVLLTY
jgi:hypothetical protein